ncbi:MAG: glycosylase [Pseudomonadota bacterium]
MSNEDTRTGFQWEKLGKVFDPGRTQGRPWLKEFAQAPATLIFDDFVRVYFSCRPSADASGQYVSYSAYVDLDRADLTRVIRVAEQPILPLGDLGTFDEFGTYPVSVIRHEGKVRAYYAGWTRCVSVPFNVAIGCAESADDGMTFQRMGPGPIIPYSLDEPFVMSGPKIRKFQNTWHLFYIAGKSWKMVRGRPEPVYRIRMASSPDGVTWTKLNKDLIETVIEDDEAQASPDVFWADGRYHMFFCYRYSENYRSHENGYRIGYASSDDLRTWTRDDARVGITVSPTGWDSEMVSYPHVFRLDGRVYMAYLGNGVGREGFGLARLTSHASWAA